AMPCPSVMATCVAEAAPLQRTWTSALLTAAPDAVAIITAPAALPSDRSAATASAYSVAGGTYALADAIALEACTRPEPDRGSQPRPRRSAAVACSNERTVPESTPFPIKAATAPLTWAAAGEVPANSHQPICVGWPGGNDCVSTPSQSPSWLTSWPGTPPGATRSRASPVFEYAVTE